MSTAATSPPKTKARIVVTGGPDKGMLFKLGEELSHVGRGSENTIVLSDPDVAEHQLSIVFRNGRYAVYTPLERSVEIDGSLIPHARWVWLPAAAKIRLSEKTALAFTFGESAPSSSERSTSERSTAKTPKGAAAAGTAAAEGEDSVVIAKKADGSTSTRKSKKKEHTVARFITDKQGEALVTLGEDGHLPELNLVEGFDRGASRSEKKESNPLVIYGLLAMSILVSLVLILADTDGPGGGSKEKAQARTEIKEFWGTDDGPLQPWQKTLREARLAASRNDRAGERRAYRKVLDQLNSEDNSKSFTGLTGSAEQDERLRKLLGVLLTN